MTNNKQNETQHTRTTTTNLENNKSRSITKQAQARKPKP